MTKQSTLLIVLLSVLLTMSVSAQQLGLKSIAPKLGIVSPEGDWNTGFFAGVGADLGELTTGLNLFPFISYWSSGYDEYDLDLSLSNIQLGADVHYHITNVQGLYVGGGLSLNFISFEYPSAEPIATPPFFRYTMAEESETKVGIGALVGYQFNLSNFNAFVEGKYNVIDEFDTLELAVGILFDMSQ